VEVAPPGVPGAGPAGAKAGAGAGPAKAEPANAPGVQPPPASPAMLRRMRGVERREAGRAVVGRRGGGEGGFGFVKRSVRVNNRNMHDMM
tara:strand:- start:2889 stop:3158 length:270 start_codon:yes stop_codon:yes gene_type:complete